VGLFYGDIKEGKWRIPIDCVIFRMHFSPSRHTQQTMPSLYIFFIHRQFMTGTYTAWLLAASPFLMSTTTTTRRSPGAETKQTVLGRSRRCSGSRRLSTLCFEKKKDNFTLVCVWSKKGYD
jgi:hypothetical protein